MSTATASTALATTPVVDIFPATELELTRSHAITRCAHTVESVKLATVTNAEEYILAEQYMVALKSAIKDVKDACEPIKGFFYTRHAAACDIEKKALNPAELKHGFLFNIRQTWKSAEERKRIAEQKRINDEIQKQQQEAAAKLAEEQQLQAAIEADAAGHPEVAAAILEQPQVIAPAPAQTVVLQSSVPKSSNVSTTTRWKARLIGADAREAKAGLKDTAVLRVQFEKLVISVAADLAKKPEDRRGLIALLDLNVSALNNMGKTQKDALNLPGCEAYPDESPSTRL